MQPLEMVNYPLRRATCGHGRFWFDVRSNRLALCGMSRRTGAREWAFTASVGNGGLHLMTLVRGVITFRHLTVKHGYTQRAQRAD